MLPGERTISETENNLSSHTTVLAKTILEQLIQLGEQAGGVLYALPKGTHVKGLLDLSHRTITVAIDLQDCVFENEVDLRYCEFTQTVNLSGSVFEQKFNSGEENETYTVYSKDLICNGAVFHSKASFKGMRVQGSAYFKGAEFTDTEEVADFNFTTFERQLDFREAKFQGPAVFRGLVCNGHGRFTKVQFEGLTRSTRAVDPIHRPISQGEAAVDFSLASFGGDFVLNKATFGGTTNILRITCGGSGLFHDATFEQEVDFRYSSFGVNLECDQACFKRTAGFVSVECRNLRCPKATFEGRTSFAELRCKGYGLFQEAEFMCPPTRRPRLENTFVFAAFGTDLTCDGALFKGRTSFKRVKCGGSGFFRPAQRNVVFHSEVDFSYSSFGVNLECEETDFVGAALLIALECGTLLCPAVTFRWIAKFDLLRCTANAFFSEARFEDQASFRFARFGANLDLQRAHFIEAVDLTSVHISSALVLGDTRFSRGVTLFDTSIKVVAWRSGVFPFQKDLLDLRGCTFEVLSIPDARTEEAAKQAARFAQAQDPQRFTRDPYLQLEKYYDSIGDDTQARRIHYQGRRALRENARTGEGSAEWSNSRKFSDLLLRWLTGYGVRTHRVVVLIFILLCIGGLVFSLDLIVSKLSLDRLLPTPPPALVPKSSATGATSPPTWLDRLTYNVDLFIPVLNSQVKQRWDPGAPGYAVYAVVHATLGWLLITLFVASWAGLVRSR